jgi:hypothetical protein
MVLAHVCVEDELFWTREKLRQFALALVKPLFHCSFSNLLIQIRKAHKHEVWARGSKRIPVAVDTDFPRN